MPVLNKASGWVGWVSDSILKVSCFPSGGSDFSLTLSELFNFAVSLPLPLFFLSKWKSIFT